jgi:hypothetical protein
MIGETVRFSKDMVVVYLKVGEFSGKLQSYRLLILKLVVYIVTTGF